MSTHRMTPEVLHLCCHLDPKWGGLGQAVVSLSKAVAATGRYRVHLMAFCGEDEQFSAPVVEGLRITRMRLDGLLGWAGMWREVGVAMSSASLAHIHGLWQPHSLLGARSARRHGVSYIVAAHGMLEPWALKAKAWKKKAYGMLLEKPILRRATCLHALTQAEIGDYRRFGLECPVIQVPNGAEMPDTCSPHRFWATWPALRDRRLVLFLGRLHPKKGIDLLCQAWAAVAPTHADAQLVIAGPDADNTRASLEDCCRKFGIGERVTFTGILTGDAKWSALRAASLFVLPSHSEGFSVATLEAMAAGCPVILTRQCHFPEVGESRAGWVIEPTVQDIVAALDEALIDSEDDLNRRGNAGKRLVAEHYSWPAIGEQWTRAYDRILKNGDSGRRASFEPDGSDRFSKQVPIV